MSEAKQTTVIAEKDVNEDAIESPAVQMEKEMEQYYDDEDRTRFWIQYTKTNIRPIDHLIFGVHGIGQQRFDFGHGKFVVDFAD